MSFYDAFKDVISVAQKADNVELYRQLLDLSAQALDLQAELSKLREENVALKEKINRKENVIRHTGAYITLADDPMNIPYCGVCYGKDEKLLQLMVDDDDYYRCYECKHYIERKP